MLTQIHVNQHVIRKNKKTGKRAPVLTVKTSKGVLRGNRVIAPGFEVVYQPDDPLSCGVHVWFETTDDVVVQQRTRTKRRRCQRVPVKPKD
jgi:hypothetical protein